MINMNPLEIIYKYYPDDNALRRLLIHHSQQVEKKALEVCSKHPELHLNEKLLRDGAMLHDLGIFLTDAPGIHCHGHFNYLLHGMLGAELMRREGREDLARICERHTGTGMTRQAFRDHGVEPPATDLCPETLEEQVICYADKFFSKSHPERERTVEETVKSLEKFGDKGVEIFRKWVEQFD